MTRQRIFTKIVYNAIAIMRKGELLIKKERKLFAAQPKMSLKNAVFISREREITN